MVHARAGILNVDLQGKLKLYDSPQGNPWGVTFIHTLNVPVDNGGPRLGSFIPIFNFELAWDYQWGPNLVGLNLGYRVREPITPSAPPQFVLDDQFILSAGFRKYIESIGFGFSLELNTATLVKNPFGAQHYSPVELFFGVTKLLPKDVTLFTGAGFNLTNALGTPGYRFLLGFTYSLSPYQENTETITEHRNIMDQMLIENKNQKKKTLAYNLPINYLNFQSGLSQLNPDTQPLLDALATTLKENLHVTQIVIRGHTDNVGDETSNHRLATNRANSIRDYLVHKGIPENKILTQGVGEQEPLTSNETLEGRLENRRIEILFNF